MAAVVGGRERRYCHDNAEIRCWLEKLDTHNPHLSVLDYKKQERSREVKELEQELEDIGVVIELKEEREAQLNDEIHKQQMCLKTEREEAEKTLAIVTSLKDRIMEEGVAQENIIKLWLLMVRNWKILLQIKRNSWQMCR